MEVPLSWRTLLLNSSYEPLATISWQRAVTLVWVDKVDVVAEYEDTVRSPSVEMEVPAVVRLRQYLRIPRTGVPFSRRNVLARDSHTCQYCGTRQRPGVLTLDHVVPRSRGGPRTWENLVACCVRCNRRKGNRTPREAGMCLARPPARPRGLVAGPGLLTGDAAPSEWVPFLPGRRAG